MVQRKSEASDAVDQPLIPEKPACGLIMPISATLNYKESHWSDVQNLLHRSIRNAGFNPANVWINETTDRISERIIANIFAHDIAVADITDLNPNVMLELGLRLASKKPTIVIVGSGGIIPFDIRDFEVLQYPGDLNIISMENFFIRFEKALNDKYNAFSDEKYVPFLGNVVVDVLSPQTRPVDAQHLLITRIDDLSSRFQRLEGVISNAKTKTLAQDKSLSITLRFKIAGEYSISVLRRLEAAIDRNPGLISTFVASGKNAEPRFTVLATDGYSEAELHNLIIEIAFVIGITPDKVTFI